MVARSHVERSGAVARKNDVVLARPFRHQHSKSARRLLDVASKRYSPSQRPRKFRRAGEKNFTRPGNDDLSRSPTKPAGAPERKLGPRTDGTVHGWDRQLHRTGDSGIR